MRAIGAALALTLATTAAIRPPVALAAAAAERPYGEWQGSMVLPQGDQADMSFELSDMAGRPMATLSIPGSDVTGPSNIVLKNGELAFGVKMDGSWLRCDLARRTDGSYEGLCSDGGSYEGAIRLWRPADPSSG